MKKIVVPESILTAAWKAVGAKMKECVEEGKGNSLPELHVARIAVEAAFQSLAENPIPLTVEARDIIGAGFRSMSLTGEFEWASFLCSEWQRRMFLASEQEEIEYDLDPEKVRFRAALEKLAKLGNGDSYGNSQGNEIAQEALGMDKCSPKQETSAEVKDLLADEFICESLTIDRRTFNGSIFEAYRRGKETKKFEINRVEIDTNIHFEPKPMSSCVVEEVAEQDSYHPDPIIETMNRRMAEYSDWVAENLVRDSKGAELLPRLDWDKPGRKVFTYGDVMKAGSK